MSRIRSFTTAFVVLALTASVGAPLHAQDVTSGPSIVAVDSTLATNPAVVIAPAVNAAVVNTAPAPSFIAQSPVALRAIVSTNAPAPPMIREQTSRSVAMMIVGGAGLIVGSIVGGDSGNIIMVGGGVVGLIGLWNYLK